jgi:hypothetical protein
MHSLEEGERFSKAHDFNKHPERKGGMRIPVSFLKMLDKSLSASFCFLLQFVKPSLICLLAQTGQIPRIGVSKRSALMGEQIGELGPHSHLDPLKSVHHYDSQLTVKDVMMPDNIQRRAGLYYSVGFTKWIKVTTQPIVIDCLQSGNENITVGDKTSGNEQVGLLLKGERGLFVSHSTPNKEKTRRITHPDLTDRERRGGYAGIRIRRKHRKVKEKFILFSE